MSFELGLSPDEFSEMARRATDLIASYYRELPEMPVMPVTTSAAVRELLQEPLPQEGTRFEEVLDTVQRTVYPLSRHNGHPRFFGYVASPGTGAAAVGDVLASGLNANVTSWRSAPAAAEMEHLIIDWFKSMIGFDAGAAGLLVSGGSMANFCALAAARTVADPGITSRGSSRVPALRIYVSDEAHFSMYKAARLLGVGSDNVQAIPTDASHRMNVAELERRIETDKREGFKPMCVVANAGTVATGAVDPFPAIADVAERHGVWLHVDGAYGGFAALAPSTKEVFRGMERAQSITLDPHKWLYSSVGCGCVLYRDARAANATFAHDAEYTRTIGLSRDEAFVFWDFGPELSRPFRALPIWLQIKLHGVRNLAAAIEKNMECARYFGSAITAAEDFELLAPIGLSIFCFRYRPPEYAGDLDALNERILVELQRGGSSYLSNANVNGKFALRGCVLNYRTSLADMDRLFADVRAVARLALT
jgi:glutamate/tyrosine decarboxylase-like PLP-dependent enzyme